MAFHDAEQNKAMLRPMELKSVDGRATLAEDAVVLTFDSKLGVTAKKEVSPRVIPFKHVREVDFAAPIVWKPGHLRIITHADQERKNPALDTYAVQLGAGRRLKEAQEFVELLQAAVAAVECEEPEPSTEVVKTAPTFKDVIRNAQEAGNAYSELKKNTGMFRGLVLSGRTLSKGNQSWPASECEIVIDSGANVSARVTGTRVAAGAILAGPAGALLGSIAKKDRSAIYMTVITPDDMFLEKVSGLDEAKAREFATKVKRAGMLQSREDEKAAADEANRHTAAVPAPPPRGVPAGWYPRGDVQEYWDGSAWTGNTAPLVHD
ncbi:hypothetical protein ASG79_13700 [Arthrobacter sp. Soil761]|nr:hypothetical protein ASG79_13700 [Arthrobacter sp. Soil761]